MFDVFLARFGIGISCPGDTPVNTAAHVVGDFSYQFVNVGGENGTVNLTVSLSDSAGHHIDTDLPGITAGLTRT